MNRLKFLDGLRGIAIALVILFHAFARWPELVGSEYANTAFAQGKMGVELFFLISGFVILMSLEKSNGIADFLRRRWLRLFPAMLVASFFVYVTAPLFLRPLGQPVLRDLLPGLTFIEPSWWGALIGSPQGVLEGSFWSLFVEVKFYVVVSLLYFYSGERGAIGGLIAMFVAPMAVGRLQFAQMVYATANILSSWHWGWFAAGALYYKYASTKKPFFFIAALAVSLLAAFTVEAPSVPAALCMALLFAAAQISDPLRLALSNRFVVFLGFVSYPLYLMHENMMVATIVVLHHVTPWAPHALVPAIPVAVLLVLAWASAKHVEPALRQWLDKRRIRMVGIKRA